MLILFLLPYCQYVDLRDGGEELLAKMDATLVEAVSSV